MSFQKRKSMRLSSYDYSNAGHYFVTICTQNRQCVFGEIVDGQMQLNDAGQMVEFWWDKLPDRFTNIKLDAFIVMPEHVHGIIQIVGTNPCVGPENLTLGQMMQWFKTMSTNQYIRAVKNGHFKPFKKRLWQRNYYDHIIRNENDLQKIQEYIVKNPKKYEGGHMGPPVQY